MSVEQYGRPDLRPAERAARASNDNAALRFEVAGLRRALQTQATIEQAKGVLMMRYGISAEAAFALLAGWSVEHHVRLRRVAVRLLDQLEQRIESVDRVDSPDAFLDRVLSGA